MTDEEILALGIQADLCDEYGTINWEYGFKKEIIAFAKLVAEKERESIWNILFEYAGRDDLSLDDESLLKHLADLIRARGEQ